MTALALIAGGPAGGGLALLIYALAPVRRHSYVPGADRSAVSQERTGQSTSSAVDAVTDWGTRVHWLRASARDLDLADLSPRDLTIRKLIAAGIGFALPGVIILAMAISGLRVPLTVPLVVCLAGALGFSMLPDLDVRRRAKQAQQELTRAVCAYLDMVALERAATAGPLQALQQAADIAHGSAFRRIAAALHAADLDGRHAWDGLAELGERTGVPALVDTADIMRLSGQDGAAVYDTLRARAASLRGQILAHTTAKAHADSEHMVIPATALVAVFVAFIGYPFVAVLFG